MTAREQEDRIQAQEERQQNNDRMVSGREPESEHETISGNRSRNDTARQRRRLFQGHHFCSHGYVDIGMMDSECPPSGALHFVDKRGKMSASSGIILSTCCHCNVFKFSPLSEVPTVFRQRLTTSDTDARKLREQSQLYNAV